MPSVSFSGPWATQLLQQRLAGIPGTVGVVAMDLATGATAAINPDAQFPAGSVAKVPIAMTLLHLVNLGSVSLDDTVSYQSSTDYEGGAGSLQFVIKEAQGLTLGVLLDRMIIVSDNIARNMIERYIGSGTIRDYMLSQGVQPPYYAPWPMMTARGANTLLDHLDGMRAGITPELTRHLLSLMASTVFNDRIPASLPPNTDVSHKVATLATDVHDIGLVYAPHGSFAISVFSESIPYDDATRLIADLAATIYWYEDWLAQT